MDNTADNITSIPPQTNIDGKKIKSYLAECRPFIDGINEVIGRYVTEPQKNITPVMIDGKISIVFDSYKAFPFDSMYSDNFKKDI